MKPTGDDGYFEAMCRIIFGSGLNWQVVEKKWQGIQAAWLNFEIEKVAAFSEPDIESLLANPAVIRNRPKIEAAISNAREIQKIATEHGSFAAYLAKLAAAGGEPALCNAVSKRFAFLGKTTTAMFLVSVGEDMPEARRECGARFGTAG